MVIKSLSGADVVLDPDRIVKVEILNKDSFRPDYSNGYLIYFEDSHGLIHMTMIDKETYLEKIRDKQ